MIIIFYKFVVQSIVNYWEACFISTTVTKKKSLISCWTDIHQLKASNQFVHIQTEKKNPTDRIVGRSVHLPSRNAIFGAKTSRSPKKYRRNLCQDRVEAHLPTYLSRARFCRSTISKLHFASSFTDDCLFLSTLIYDRLKSSSPPIAVVTSAREGPLEDATRSWFAFKSTYSASKGKQQHHGNASVFGTASQTPVSIFVAFHRDGGVRWRV